MRTHEVRGMKFEINGLTRKAFKKLKLKDYGYDFFEMTETPEDKKPGDCIDKLIEVTVAGADHKNLDELTGREFKGLYYACIKELYGAEEEEKNSSTSGSASPEKTKK